MHTPKLHVITRTSGRPNFFKICRQSVIQQTYPNINHIVIIDDKNDNSYVENYSGIQKIYVKAKDYVHWEQFLNAGLGAVPEDDYLCIIDDDDFYTSPDSLKKAMITLDNNNIVFWRVKAAGGVVPGAGHWKKSLPFGQISMIGWIVKKKFIGEATFTPGYGGDHRFIANITDVNSMPHYKWHDEILSTTNPIRPQGGGGQLDAIDRRVREGFKQKSSRFNHDFV